jgi:hypothetical protein
MSRQLPSYDRAAVKPGAGQTARAVFASVVGLLPVAIVTGMMLMQILGFWRY